MRDAVERCSQRVEEADRRAADAHAELVVTRTALQAVLALHRDTSGSCTHCHQAHRCPTVAAIEAGSRQACEELWRRT